MIDNSMLAACGRLLTGFQGHINALKNVIPLGLFTLYYEYKVMTKVFGIKHHKLKTYICRKQRKDRKEFEIGLVKAVARDPNFLVSRLQD